MGKSKNKIGKSGDNIKKPYSLPDQILSNDIVTKDRSKNSTSNAKEQFAEETGSKVVGDTLSRKILKQAKKQLEELEEAGDDATVSNFKNKKITLHSSARKIVNDEDDDSDDADSIDFSMNPQDNEPEIDEEEEKALRKFMLTSRVTDEKASTTLGTIKQGQEQQSVGDNRLLSDIIMEKIDEKRFELESQMSSSQIEKQQKNVANLDPRLVDMFKDVGKVLSTYRSGKLPKAFKIIPKMTNWEQVLFLTSPENWTAASMYQATRIFVSNLNVKMCQRFLGLILFPRIRDDIAEFKKLNFHLYQALAKGLFKPAAFFKAILLPLCESGTCTLREATIIGSLLTKCSVPSLHAAAAMLKLAEMNYSGANSLFLRLLIDKKYTLPFRVIDGLVDHFLRFATDDRDLPVLWHQCFLTFVQRYKNDLSTEQKEHLMDLLKKHFHYQISPEIRRELTHSTPRDLEDQEPQYPDIDDDDDDRSMDDESDD